MGRANRVETLALLSETGLLRQPASFRSQTWSSFCYHIGPMTLPRATVKERAVAVVGLVSAVIAVFAFVSGKQTLHDVLALFGGKGSTWSWPKLPTPPPADEAQFQFDLPFDATVQHAGASLRCYTSLLPNQGAFLLCPHGLRDRDLVFVVALAHEEKLAGPVRFEMSPYDFHLVNSSAEGLGGSIDRDTWLLSPGQHGELRVTIYGPLSRTRPASYAAFIQTVADDSFTKVGPVAKRILIIK